MTKMMQFWAWPKCAGAIWIAGTGLQPGTHVAKQISTPWERKNFEPRTGGRSTCHCTMWKKKRVGDQTACCVAFFVCLNFPGKWLGLCVIKIYAPQMWINSIWKYLPLNLMHVYPLLYPYMIIYIRTTQIISNIKGCRRSVAGTALLFSEGKGL